MEELIADYESGSLHPGDVKPALAKAINQILQVILSLFLVLHLYLGALVLDPCKVIYIVIDVINFLIKSSINFVD